MEGDWLVGGGGHLKKKKHMITYFIYDFSRAALEEVEGDVAELELKLDKVNFTLKVF